ncbi:MAG: hypothetical protein DBY20_05785 [Coriobacteriia bacterium]|nr:MAG: hypothetical protein DBY20_05785 [Coriobacteriia bacterium]
MDNSNLDDYENMRRPQNGRMSAANQPYRKPAPRPSTDELAPYGAANYVSHGSKTRTHRHVRKPIIAGVAVIIVLLLIVPGTALAVSAKNAMDDARILMNQGSALVSQIQSGDVQGAQRTATNLNSIAKELDANVNGPLWVPLTFIPVYGDDVKSIRTLAEVANKLSEQVLIPIAQGLSTDGNARLFVDGGFNIPVIQAMLTPIGAASDTIRECARQVNELSEPHIVQLMSPVMTVKSLMSVLSEVTGYASDLSRALPGILGANGPRTYLIMACSEAELRSVGGFPGSTGLMTVDNGKLEIGEMTAPNLSFAQSEDEVLELTDEERTLFGTRAGEYFYDAGYNPHFPRAAEIMKSIWDANKKPPFDGIISVDPVFLQSILELTGGVTTSDGVAVNGSNAAEVLMNSAYIMYSTESFEDESTESPDIAADDQKTAYALASAKQNAFFSEVASLALDAFFGNIDSVSMLSAVQVIGDSIADKRIYMWVANPEEQAVIEKLDAACAISMSEANPELGVYLATTVASKGNWYINSDTTVGNETKNADGSTSYSVTTTITNTLSPDDAANLPAILTTPDQYAVGKVRSKGDMILDVYLFAPMGGVITDLQVEGDFAPDTFFDDVGVWYTQPGIEPMTRATYNGHEVWYGVTMIEGLQSTTLTYTVTTSPNAVETLVIDTTPLGQE